MSQVLETERPLRLHAGGPEVWQPEGNRPPASTATPASRRWTEGLEVVAAPAAATIVRDITWLRLPNMGATGMKPAGAKMRFDLAFWFPDLGSTDARSEGAGMFSPAARLTGPLKKSSNSFRIHAIS